MPRQHWDDEQLPSPWEQEEDIEERWRRKLQQARQTPANGLPLGRSIATRLPVYVTPEQISTHMHVIGGTGSGKSYFLDGVLKSLILQGQGLCLIDPHGDLYHRILDFCTYLDREQPERQLARCVIPFDVAETNQIIGFNPVQRNARIMTYQVLALMEAIRKVWGQDSFQDTPRLARWLFNAAYGVIDANLTLVQTQYLVDPKPNPFRAAIIERITNPRIRAEWEWFSSIRDRDRNEFTESSFNRLQPFVIHEIVRNILGQHTSTLDFSSVLSERKIVLVNLAKQSTIPEDYQHLIGTLLVNEILTAAFARKPKERTPFYLFIDEFQHFVTKDMCEILDGGRKFGLHLILAHQHLNQLKIKDPEVYYSTLTNARIKAVFGGLIDEDLDVLSRELYTGELDPNEIKDEIWQTKFRPVESSRTIVSDSWSESTGESYGEASSYGEAASYGHISHQSISAGEVYIPGSGFWSEEELQNTSKNAASGDSYSSATSTTTARSTNSSRQSTSSTSQSVTNVPWYEYHEFSELSSRTFRSLEEQLYIKKAQLKRQPSQHAALLIPGTNVQILRTRNLKTFEVSESAREQFKEACFTEAGCYKTPAEAERELESLEQKLLAEAKPVIEVQNKPLKRARGGRKKKEPIFASALTDEDD
jgi:hypothetical protein